MGFLDISHSSHVADEFVPNNQNVHIYVKHLNEFFSQGYLEIFITALPPSQDASAGREQIRRCIKKSPLRNLSSS